MTYFMLTGVCPPEFDCIGGIPLADTSGLFECDTVSCDATSPACWCFCVLPTIVLVNGEFTDVPITTGRHVTAFVTTVTVVVAGCDTDRFVSASVLAGSRDVTGTGGVCFFMKWSGSGNLRFGLSSLSWGW